MRDSEAMTVWAHLAQTRSDHGLTGRTERMKTVRAGYPLAPDNLYYNRNSDTCCVAIHISTDRSII